MAVIMTCIMRTRVPKTKCTCLIEMITTTVKNWMNTIVAKMMNNIVAKVMKTIVTEMMEITMLEVKNLKNSLIRENMMSLWKLL